MLSFTRFASLVLSTVLLASAGAKANQISMASEDLGLSWLKDRNSIAAREWTQAENKKAREFLSVDAGGVANPFYQELTARYADLAASNPAPFVQTPEGRVFTKAGGLAIMDPSGKESWLVKKLTHTDGSGTSTIAEFKLSPDETKVAYSYIKNGGDMNSWFVLDLSSWQVIAGPFQVRLGDFSWATDSKAIYYTHWPHRPMLGLKTQNFKVDLHSGKSELVFTPPQANAREIYAIDDFDFDGNRHFVAHRVQGPAEVPVAVYVGRIGTAGLKEFQVGRYAWRTVRHPESDRLGRYIASDDLHLLLRSSEAGNSFGIVAVDVSGGMNMKTSVVVPARAGQVLLNAQPVGNRLLLQFICTKTFEWSIEIADFRGKILKVLKPSDVGLLDSGTLTPFTAARFGKEAFFVASEMRQPNTTVRLDLATEKLEVMKSAKAVPFDGTRVKYEMKWIPSADGTLIPLTVFTRTDIAKPTFGYLTYYGYIGLTSFSSWNRKLQMALEMGGAVVLVHHRGGGELGADWQLSVKRDRLTSLEDTVAAGRWMRKNLNVDKISVMGRSFGGLHSMQLYVHHPEEFDAFIPVVPVSDVNEFLSRGTFGFYAADDFGIDHDALGTPLDTESWRWELAAWSPLANLRKVKALKPIMIFTADHDDRVDPEQGAYFAAALNKKFPGNSMVYLYEEKDNGHFGRTEFLDESAFLGRVFDIKTLQPLK